jgi:hypothetical protein
MGLIHRILGYATIGVAKESAKRAWESDDSIESGILAAQTGVLAEAAQILLEREFKEEED